ncbi:ABC transporter permease [Neisseria dentiae]|uniref:ABC transporter permease n=1 Tax=Neisseria dentiae TaxID=194197 RepID=UPI0035A196EA
MTPSIFHGMVRRLSALIKKEFRQLVRDKSNLMVGLGLPAVLILIFGYGITLDVKNVPLAVVSQSPSAVSQQMIESIDGSPYITVKQVASQQAAKELIISHQAGGMLYIPPDFAAQLSAGTAKVQLLVNGGDQSRAQALLGYVSGAVNLWLQEQGLAGAGGGVTVVDRIWFNAANSSTWYLVPGLIVLIMTLVGAFLTALVMAREWERGTLESLFVTPVHSVEILLAKIVPYFCVGMVGLVMCLVAARLLFNVPIHGSLWLVMGSGMLYMLVSLALGLLISAATKNQFVASQVALLASFMPSMMLSGFMFDLRNVPEAINIIGHLLPATYFMELIKTLFLAGDHWPTILKNGAILAVYAVLLLGLAVRVTRKRLD